MTDRGNRNGGNALAWAMSGLLYAQAAGASSGDAPQRGKMPPRLEQKRALVERMLFESPLGRQASVAATELDPAVYREWDSARRAYEQALTSLASDHQAQAETSLDMALNLYRNASNRNRHEEQSARAQRDSLDALTDRIRGYQASLERIVHEKNAAESLDLDAAWVEGEIARAGVLDREGRSEQALNTLRAAQARLEHALVEARSGETLVTRLEFDSPEAALAYEIDKLGSNERLLEALATNSTVSEGKRKLLGTYLNQSRTASARARGYLESGRLDEAARAAEAANAAQTRALRLFGVSM